MTTTSKIYIKFFRFNELVEGINQHPLGINFYSIEKWMKWVHEGTSVAFLKIPADVSIEEDSDCFHTNTTDVLKVVEKDDEFEWMEDFLSTYDETTTGSNCRSLTYKDGILQTYVMCASIVSRNPFFIKHVVNQHQMLCFVAVRENGFSLKYVKEQDREICTAAVSENGFALKYVKDQTAAICKVAVTQNWRTIKLVENLTPELCLIAVESELVNGDALHLIPDEFQTPEVIIASVTRNGLNIYYVSEKNQSFEVCVAALKQDIYALEYIKTQTPGICLEAVNIDGIGLDLVRIQTPEICLAAVKQNGLALDYVELQTFDICVAAILQDPDAIEYVEDQTEELAERVSRVLFPSA